MPPGPGPLHVHGRWGLEREPGREDQLIEWDAEGMEVHRYSAASDSSTGVHSPRISNTSGSTLNFTSS